MTIIILCLLFSIPVHAEPQTGQPAPALTGKELDGTAFDLATMRGKVVIVHFWATWCPSCKEEMPVLDDFYRKYHARGVEIVAVSADRPHSRDDVVAFMKPLAFPAAMLNDVADNGFGRPEALPVTYIIDRAGILRAKLTPDEQILTPQILAKTVEPLLNPPQNGK